MYASFDAEAAVIRSDRGTDGGHWPLYKRGPKLQGLSLGNKSSISLPGNMDVRHLYLMDPMKASAAGSSSGWKLAAILPSCADECSGLDWPSHFMAEAIISMLMMLLIRGE
jgi:hypothetical protein